MIRNGDRIAIDIPDRTINIQITAEELEARRKEELSKGAAAFKSRRQRSVSKALREYALFAASADKGAVRIVPKDL